MPDPVFAHLVLARIVEPTSKLDSIRVLEELGVAAPSYSTIQRRLEDCVAQDWRSAIQAACLTHAVKGCDLKFCLYDVSTLHWETHQGDGFRESGFSNYADLVIMPMFLLLMVFLCWSQSCAVVMVSA